MKQLTDEQIVRLWRYYRPLVTVERDNVADICIDLLNELVRRNISG